MVAFPFVPGDHQRYLANMAPKAFISHASEDKPRFVESFATLLREFGVDAWLDKWEMQPGDSLVDRIFEEGIKSTDAFVVVLSQNSVDKPWVREELNAGVVKRISGKCKVIPVVIDECDVPECLKSTLWEKITSLDDIRSQTQRIANAIHGVNEKPPVGATPRVSTTALDVFTELTRQDQLLLAAACESTLDTGWPMVTSTHIHQPLIDQGLSPEEIHESLQVLDGRHYISVQWAMGGGWSHFDIPTSTFETFIKATQSDYPLMVNEICIQILNHNRRTNLELQQATGYLARIVNHVMDMLESQKLVTVVRAMGGGIHVASVSPELSRQFRS